MPTPSPAHDPDPPRCESPLHGVDIATGLDVTVEDNATVHVSPGVAIDALGREIVLTEEPADEVIGADGLVPGRFVERPRLVLVEHGLGEAPEHAVPLARVHRHGDELAADPSVRLHLRQPLHGGPAAGAEQPL